MTFYLVIFILIINLILTIVYLELFRRMLKKFFRTTRYDFVQVKTAQRAQSKKLDLILKKGEE